MNWIKYHFHQYTPLAGGKGDLLRIGLIGFGNRAVTHANGLGYMHPEDAEKRKLNGTLEDWLMQEDLNVAITGICDVFDLHAERGLETVRNAVRAGGAKIGSAGKALSFLPGDA